MQRDLPTKSTNPFDDDDDFDGNDIVNSNGNGNGNGKENDDIFHDAQQEAPRQRSAQLNFDNPFDAIEEPALRFDQVRKLSTEFVSPLESAMKLVGTNPMRDTGYSPLANCNTFLPQDDDITESSPLLRSTASSAIRPIIPSPGRHGVPSEISTGGPSPSRLKVSTTTTTTTTSTRRRSSLATNNAVLTELASGENEFTMDYKYILLEDLGTASSWLILLLPYVTFFLSLLLESSKTLKVTTLGPLAANLSCAANFVGKEPLLPISVLPCHASFQERQVEQGHYDVMAGKFNVTTTQYAGLVFDSGILPSIPVLSTDLFGDAIFHGLASETVALVSQRQVVTSVAVFQQPIEPGNADWTLMFTSAPKTLSMACQESSIQTNLWDCKSPRLVNVVFSMPDSAVYAAGKLRVHVYYSLNSKQEPTFSSREQVETAVYTKTKQDSSELTLMEIKDPYLLLEDLVSSSAYTMEHMSELAMKLDTGVRLGAFLISFWFVIYWCYSMGIHGFCACCGSRGKKEGEISKYANIFATA